jgi:hypothetical protein
MSDLQLSGSLPDMSNLRIVHRRHWGRWFAAAVILGLLVFLALAFAHGAIEWRYVGQFLAAPAILQLLLWFNLALMEDWFRAGAADGFNVMPPFFPGQFNAFVDLVVPVLQKRGLFRRDYEGATLRQNLGLERPTNRFS